MLKLSIVLALAATAFGQALCPGSNSAPDKNGILRELQQIGKLIPSANSGAKLSLVDLESQGVCQFQFLSAEKRQKLIFVDLQGTIRLSATVPMTGTELGPLPDGFVDLPGAISAAQRLALASKHLAVFQPHHARATSSHLHSGRGAGCRNSSRLPARIATGC